MENKEKKNIGAIVKGGLFDADILFNNYKIISFGVLLAVISIISSHAMDNKVYEISKLRKDVRELKSEFVSVRTQLMNSRMGSSLQKKVKEKGLEASTTPPYVIIVDKE